MSNVLHVRDQMLNKFYHAGEECNRAALACVGALAAFDTAESFNIASGLDINPHNKTHSQKGVYMCLELPLIKSIEVETGVTTLLMKQHETGLMGEPAILLGEVAMADAEDKDWAQEVCCMKGIHVSCLLGLLSLLLDTRQT
uniref:Uncharacterized protein n=1 Tax=Physcomitrium patens TaxID=3218 RepID=A0A2K1IR51_PHYPA|nr:hypothetical protein PHYPA_025879 [Physcomitrium patens]